MNLKKNIPNTLSFVRIVIAIIFPFITLNLQIVFLSLAFITEYFDGMLARKYNWVTIVGQVLDPLADKLLALSVGMTLIVTNKISLLTLIFIYTRDITAALGFLIIVIILKKNSALKRFQPNLIGKLTTAFQYLVFFNILLRTTPDNWLIVITGILSIIAAIQYTLNFFRTN